jgi:hypothetical protein
VKLEAANCDGVVLKPVLDVNHLVVGFVETFLHRVFCVACRRRARAEPRHTCAMEDILGSKDRNKRATRRTRDEVQKLLLLSLYR